MNKYISIVHLDGPDKTGKDTIRRELIKRSDGNILVICRSYISQLVYADIYERDVNSGFFIDNMKKAQNIGHIFIYLECEKEQLRYRFEKHNEKHLKFEDYDKHKKCFDMYVEYLKGLGIKIKTISTNTLIENSVKNILNYIETINNGTAIN